jgi:hypothetical protein
VIPFHFLQTSEPSVPQRRISRASAPGLVAICR